MTIELNGLIALAILILVYVSAHGLIQKAEVGNKWTVGPRDTAREPGRYTGRAARALKNLLETAPVYICLALYIHLADRSTLLSQWGAIIYLTGRALYLPAYLSGIPWLRTIIWNIATAALAAMLVGTFMAPQ